MTRTEERLADALDAAASALEEDTLRPLLVPERPRRLSALAAPVAAAAALLLVVGAGVLVASYLPGSGTQGAAAAPPPYYVEAPGNGGPPMVWSTATHAMTATLNIPYVPSPTVRDVVAASATGAFFAAVTASRAEKIYRFRLSAAGRVEGLTSIPDGALASGQWTVDDMAPSPDGSRLAVALSPANGTVSANCSSSGTCSSSTSSSNSVEADRIEVVNLATGARSLWQGGTGQNFSFAVINLSWTSNGNKLVYFGQWCRQGNADIASCQPGAVTRGAKAQVWALNPDSKGGSLTGGSLLFRASANSPRIPQALISPDGTTITAVSVTSPAAASGTRAKLSVEQISVARGSRERVLYSQNLGSAPSGDVIATLTNDGTGRYWMVSGESCGDNAICRTGFNGWVDGGRLISLQPADGSEVSEAW
jgi:hypothetical protein